MDEIAFNAANVLFAVEQDGANLHTIDQTTGKLTLSWPNRN